MYEPIPDQEVIIEVTADITVIGYAPHYKYNEAGEKIDILESDPLWAIKKYTTIGNKTTLRWAEGDQFHNKKMSIWNSYNY